MKKRCLMEMIFEESLLELEGIVEKLEKGQLSLDESLVLFEKGIKLVRECSSTLQNAQQKVESLIAENNDLKPGPFVQEL
ncbi:MAG: exodeoxyribonuclease VII small subunit [Candidatus Methanoperedens sp.]|nr:exodeoxyribonuclease VII small subunit [Candidatus Methanoperedens sp.]MCE8424650.1 exodeoxyribonuclease VII small subunit [Candidatus Methanoperedens sp.]MCE8426901.1 exodeoxyribonuclease VII small subunit [Candidatus Methanoperedens sp.]